MQSIPPTTENKQTQAQEKRGSMARKLLGANAKSYRLKLKLYDYYIMNNNNIITGIISIIIKRSLSPKSRPIPQTIIIT